MWTGLHLSQILISTSSSPSSRPKALVSHVASPTCRTRTSGEALSRDASQKLGLPRLYEPLPSRVVSHAWPATRAMRKNGIKYTAGGTAYEAVKQCMVGAQRVVRGPRLCSLPYRLYAPQVTPRRRPLHVSRPCCWHVACSLSGRMSVRPCCGVNNIA